MEAGTEERGGKESDREGGRMEQVNGREGITNMFLFHRICNTHLEFA